MTEVQNPAEPDNHSHAPRVEDAPDAPQPSAEPMPELSWRWMLAAGLVYVAGGFIALLNPFLASLFAESLIALAFMLGGLLALLLAFRNKDGTTGGRVLSGVSALLAIAFAVALWMNPIIGLVSLTLTVASFLVAIGAVRTWVGVRMRKRAGWGWFVASGVLTVLLGVYIFVTLPASALSILGLFLAFELTFAGAAQIAAAWQARAEEKELPGSAVSA